MSKKKKTFIRRSYDIYRHQRDRAKPIELDYTLEDLRELVSTYLDAKCPHCESKLTVRNFGIDHNLPVVRGGEHKLDNLRVMCMSCNTIKGPLTSIEFMKLLQFLKTLPLDIETNIKARMKAGSRIAKFTP
jgi:5-methylcytosine-specific restriction endonuclease McrA